MTTWRYGLVLASIIAVAGCSGSASNYLSATGAPSRIELTEVPFFPQTAHHCGPAALATVLKFSDVPIAPDALAAEVFIPGRKGAFRAELLAAARRHHRVAYVLPTRLDAVIREVAAGRPVLVLQNLSGTQTPNWHYAVVVGYDSATEELLLRSGIHKRVRLSISAFDASWRAAGRWASIILRPGELPVEVEQARYARSVVGLERVGAWHAAQQAWQGARELWPTALPVLMGLGNTYYALGEPSQAALMLRQAVRHHPGAADAHNNLAHVLFELGKQRDALRHASKAVELGGPNRAEYTKTLAQVRD